MKRIIINADDFGLTPGVNEGILECLQKGVVSSTSALVNFPSSEAALNLARQHNLNIGWHINLTLGQPLSDPKDIPSLVTREGTFHSLQSLLIRSFWGKISAQDVEKELTAQYEMFERFGLSLSHANGHQHVHVFPIIRDVVRDMARSKKIPYVRIPQESASLRLPRPLTRIFFQLITTNLDFGVPAFPFYGFTFGNCSHDLSEWEKLLSRITSETSEVMMHPARIRKEDDYYGDDFPGDREKECQLLLSQELKELIMRKGFQLGTF